MCEQCDKIKKKLDEFTEDARDFIIQEIHDHDENSHALIEMPLEQLPLHINDYPQSSIQNKIIADRLEGKEIKLSDLMQILWDCEFNYDDYKQLGHNDGMIYVISQIYTILGDEKGRERVCEATYSD